MRKNDGLEEGFDKNKVLSGCMKAGANIDEAEKVASQIEAWLPGVAANGVINSADIRLKVVELLSAFNPVAATSFERYKKVV